jgi:hypothetical protein
MFEIDIGLCASGVQFPPMERSEYRVVSFLGDEEKTICTVKVKENVFTYLTSNSVNTGMIDISQQTNAIELEMHREGEMESRAFKVDGNRLGSLGNEGPS